MVATAEYFLKRGVIFVGYVNSPERQRNRYYKDENFYHCGSPIN